MLFGEVGGGPEVVLVDNQPREVFLLRQDFAQPSFPVVVIVPFECQAGGFSRCAERFECRETSLQNVGKYFISGEDVFVF